MELRSFTKGTHLQPELMENKVLLMVKGVMHITFGDHHDTIKEGDMIVVSCGYKYRAEFPEDAKYILVRMRNNLQLCDSFSIEKLFTEKAECSSPCCPLPMNRAMQMYVTLLTSFLEDRINCTYFYEFKMKEFYFILRNYYTKEELQSFFKPMLSHDLSFSDFVLKNHRKVKNVIEFAELANYSISGFEKRFKKVFHISAYKWMKEQKEKDILHEIRYSGKTFKEIGWEYGFSSPAQFNDFCKSGFGLTPGQLRSSVLQETD